MLVLTRKRAEKIQIGEDIVVKVIKTGRSTVKIGIEAPTGVRIMRAELCENTSEETVKPSSEEIELDSLGPGSPFSLYCSDQYPHAI